MFNVEDKNTSNNFCDLSAVSLPCQFFVHRTEFTRRNKDPECENEDPELSAHVNKHETTSNMPTFSIFATKYLGAVSAETEIFAAFAGIVSPQTLGRLTKGFSWFCPQGSGSPHSHPLFSCSVNTHTHTRLVAAQKSGTNNKRKSVELLPPKTKDSLLQRLNPCRSSVKK